MLDTTRAAKARGVSLDLPYETSRKVPRAHVYSEEVSMRRRNELTRSILKALQTPNRPVQGNPSTLGDTKIARNAVFKSVTYVLTSSEHLVAEYDRLDKLIESLRDAEPEGIAEKWTENVDKTARLLRLGAGTAIRNVKKVLGADIANGEVEEADENAERMEGLEKMELDYDFHKSLQYAERGVKKMVKGLPQEEDG
ncbi:hypothetical protein N0V94_007210 [Neodidymelliopsis sp. IMI 364377]|nr:hypothetical protein N0V94_007210 [Neodidymelliopsis sp. IMI 364377]